MKPTCNLLKATLFLVMVFAACLSCASKPDTSYYNDLIELLTNIEKEVRSANYDYRSVDKSLIKDTQDFLEEHREYSHLGTYFNINAVLLPRLQGYSIGGVDISGFERPSFMGTFYGLAEQILDEAQQYNIKINEAELTNIMNRNRKR